MTTESPNTQWPEDFGHQSGDVGDFILGVRNDNDIVFTDTDLDYSPIAVDSTGAVKVSVINSVTPVTGIVTTTRNVAGRIGTYHVASPDSLLSSAADSATSGRWWLVNNSNEITVRLIEVRFTCHLTNLLDLGSQVPEVSMERITFTGTPSGATVLPAKRDSLDPNNTGSFRTASTGMTITAGAAIKRFIPVTLSVIGGILSANTAALSPTEQLFQPRDDSGDIILRQGEGIVWRQSTVGTSNEQRSIQIDLIWEEFDN